MFDSSQSEQILEIVTQKIEKAAEHGTLDTTPYLDRALVFWAGRRGQQAVKDYASLLAKEERGLADLVVASISNVYLSSSDRRYNASPTFLEELGFSASDVATQCEVWLAEGREWTTELRQEAMETFVDAVRNPKDQFGFPRSS